MDVSDQNAEERNLTVEKLKKRTTFIKYKSTGKSYSRTYFLTLSEDAIRYLGSRRGGKSKAYRVNDIDEIRLGFNTAVWRKCLEKRMVELSQNKLALSILYNNNRSSLDLLADTEELRNSWFNGLEFLIKRYRSHLRTHREITDSWIWQLFDQADHDHSNQLNRSEIRRLLHLLNVELPNDDIDHYFNLANIRASTFRDIAHLDRQEFILFYKSITNRVDLLKIICQYNGTYKKHAEISNYHVSDKLANTTLINVPKEQLPSFKKTKKQSAIKHQHHQSDNGKEAKNYWTIEQLKDFLQNEQHMTVSIEDCAKLIKRFEPSVEGKQCEEMGVDGLRLMLLHDEFCIMNPNHANQVYHDMTRPLSDYFIATSHNTYISDNQVFGTCTPETYVRALRSGCRSVEMDCYDGDNFQPVVYHGKTLTKRVEFREILHAIKENAFVNSPYPVFLNIENHCSYGQQEVLVRLLKSILNDYLLMEPINDLSVLPSPESLKYKILIRSRRFLKGKTAADPKINNSNDETVPLPKDIHPEFANLIIYSQIVSFTNLQHSMSTQHCYHSISFKESKANELIKESPDNLDLIRLTQRQIVRIYPSSYRQDSSNLHPVFYWLYGAQMVALNYQADDESMSLQYGLFSDNCGCGYLLKPSILLSPANETKTKIPLFNPKDRLYSRGKKLTIHIISGQHLPKEKSIEGKDVIDPYVKVQIYGVEFDYHEERTPVIKNNGLNPIWDYKMSFDIYCPELCLVRFIVKDQDKYGRSDFVGQYCLRFQSLQLGYRHIKLKSKNEDYIQGTLFVHIKIDDF
ncbi:unnamed protein product [Didymodactylos carnosus]|uniref:Phosphoinositide phospholipase C n=2 Tax=Didymodactylos carnosus TaxID=1234261 RepID=A0A8S2CL52_9BILA|nr:unnamed protein product [Didymodactylos carnosus]CAF3511172.1 unnamed protein product [Didymodactylos carnosus]